MWSKEFIEDAAIGYADSIAKRDSPAWLLTMLAYKAGEEFIKKNIQKG